MYKKNFVFTSESVSEGHPDKVCDQVSDKILDLYLSQDPFAKVACETLITTNFMLVAGEIYSKHVISKEQIEKEVRNVVLNIGYNHSDVGFDANESVVDIRLHEQSADIRQGVEGKGLHKEEGAGDQGLMFGYANNETEEQMPMPIYYSHKILKVLSSLRKEGGENSFLRPDAKAQVSVDYQDGIPSKITSVVVSTQHTPEIDHRDIEDFVIEKCIKKVIPQELLKACKYYINPTGVFIIGGPHGDCGLTGRKIIVDTYGGMGRHGGGAFSGKDPSKVDRSSAYMMRYLAKNIVASGLADVCELQVAYAIGVSNPISLMVHTFGTGKVSDKKIEQCIYDNFNLTPSGIKKKLNLAYIPYFPSASYGHFGRSEDSFTWEKTDSRDVFSSLS